jgi:Phage integrase family
MSSHVAEIKRHLPDNLKGFYEFHVRDRLPTRSAPKITWGMLNDNCTRIDLPASIVKTKTPLMIVLAGPLLKPIAESLAKRKREYKKEHFKDPDPQGVVFCSIDYRDQWSRAVAKARLGTRNEETETRTGVRIHDCRCSAAINLLASGVDEGTVLKIGGWKTRAMLDRYNVQHEARVKAAMEQGGRFVQQLQQQHAARQ